MSARVDRSGAIVWPAIIAVVLGTLVAVWLVSGAKAYGAEPPTSVEVLAGAGVSVSDDTAVSPVARVTVDAPVYLGRSPVARLRVQLGVYGSPGQTLDLARVETFQGAGLDVQLGRRVGRGPASSTYIGIMAGATARKDARGEGPRERFPAWVGAYAMIQGGGEHGSARRLLLGFGGSQLVHERGRTPRDIQGGGEHGSARRLLLGFGGSQLVHERGRTPRDVFVQGAARLVSIGGAAFILAGEVQRPLWGDGRSVFRLEVLAGWGSGQ